MNRKSRRNQPFVRSRKSLLASRRTESGDLVSRAGRVERASVEQLEARQLLFSLTIDSVGPDGLGFAETFIGYVVPVYDHTGMPQMAMATTTLEDFGSEAPALPQLVVNGRVFNESNLQMTHNIAPASNVRLEAEVPGQMGIEAQRMFIRGQQDMFFAFRLNPNGAGVFSPMTSFTFTVTNTAGNSQGLPVNNMTVSLLFDGEVLETFTGGQIPSNLGDITFATTSGEVFDEIRFDFDSGTTLDGFYVDDVTIVRPGDAFSAMTEEQIYGARIRISGELGATVQFLDLYGRDMRNTIRLGIPTNGEVPLVDRNLDGVPEFNDGIGRIIFTNSNANTSLTMVGGVIMATDMPTAEGELFDNGFEFTQVEDFAGFYSNWSSLGLGYVMSTDGMTALGLPSSAGSIIIGSPWVRDNTNGGTYNLAGAVPGAPNFTRADQGIFATGGQSIGTIYLHGTVYGSSQIDGNLERINIEHLPGSFSVDGDMGGFLVGSDAGVWNPEDQMSPISIDTRRTGSQLNFGRTVREIFVGGRSGVDITVVGDLNAPGAVAPKETYRFFEQEYMYGFDPQPGEFENVIDAIFLQSDHNAVNQIFGSSSLPVVPQGQSPFAGGTLYRNDTLGSAEWISGIASAVEVHGDVGFGDPVSAEDPADVYAFASDGFTEIVLNLDAIDPLGYVRILDANGRTVANFDTNDQVVLGRIALRYRPDAPGLYYVVVAAPVDGSIVSGSAYLFTLSGMATATLGSYRTGSGLGHRDAGTLDNASVTVLSGNIGAVRVGTGIVDATGAEVDTQGFFFTNDNNDADFDATLLGGTVSTPGHLYAIWAGSDIHARSDLPTFTIGGDLGGLYVGMSPLYGLVATEGDLGPSTFTVGGRIGTIDIKGRIGADQDAMGTPLVFFGVPTTFTTGTGGGPGDIGLFRVGSAIAADHLIVNTSDNSTIGAFLTDQDTNPAAGAANSGIYQPLLLTSSGVTFNMGQGSDIRFVDFPRLDLTASFDLTIPIFTNQEILLTDDAGGVISILVPANIGGVLVGQIRVLPIDGSQGQAVGRIDVNLTGGLRLRVASQNAGDSITVGKINVTGSDANSAIEFVGPGEIDVWQIIAGDMLEILNQTVGGDIVAIDVESLFNLEIRGNLGRTFTGSYGPRLIGPFLGVGENSSDRAFTIIAPLYAGFNGMMYRPTTDAGNAVDNAYLDDMGSPVNPYLNGLVIRGDGTLAVDTINVFGSIENIVAHQTTIGTLNINSDNITPGGQFHGLNGSIYADEIVNLNVGDGIAAQTQSAMAPVGVWVNDDIHNVVATRVGASIRGVINASNLRPGDDLQTFVEGIGRIEISGGGDFVDAFISTNHSDFYWVDLWFPIETLNAGGISNLRGGEGTDFFRSWLYTGGVTSFVMAGGYYDASFSNISGNVTTFEALGFRNSTRAGGDLEFRESIIFVGGDVTTVRATAGDFEDTTIDVIGSVLERLSATNFTRARIDVDNRIFLISAENLRATSIVAGRLDTASVTQDIVASEFAISGPILLITAVNIINSSIDVTGPNGSIETIRAVNLLSGTITSTGPIQTITSTDGDIDALIVTTTALGSVNLIDAGRDFLGDTDIAGNLSTITVGRNIGALGVQSLVFVRGNLANANIANGQLHSDIRIGQGLTGAVTIGRVNSKPGASILGNGSIVAFGRINSVIVTGDFNGDIISYTGGIGTVSITDGSFYAGNTVSAFDGDLENFTVTRGHLLGNLFSDHTIFFVRVIGSDDGVFGDIGVNADLSSGVSYDDFRNQLPPGVAPAGAIQGPTIFAGRNIGLIEVTNGSMFEVGIHAGYTIALITVAGNVMNDPATLGFGSYIIAGDRIGMISISGDASDLIIAAGITGLGSDSRPGGVGDAADRVKSGAVREVVINGNATNVTVSAGITAGADGLYNTADDRHALGLSYVNIVTIGGAATNVSAHADSGITTASSGVTLGGRNTPIVDFSLEPVLGDPASLGTIITAGTVFNFTHGSESGTILFTGPGTAVWNESEGRLILINTTLLSTLVITSSSGVLTSFDIVSNDDAMLGSLNIRATLTGDSSITIDGFLNTLAIGAYTGTGSIRVGNDIQTFTIGDFTGGSLSAVRVGAITINGNFDATIDIFGSSGVNITGDYRGSISLERDLTGNVTIGGAMDRGVLRSAGSIGNVTAASMHETRITVADAIGNVTITNSVVDSDIIAGGDLGDDGLFGGVGLNADRLTTGFIGNVSVGGDFLESNLVAGFLRGTDGFFGTSDDTIAPGRGSVGAVTIGGSQVGSNLNSEAYRISSTGAIGAVTVNGNPFSSSGNFEVDAAATTPLPIQVTDLRVVEDSRVFTAQITFNQAMEFLSLSSSLSVYEVRGSSGQTLIRLNEGLDFELTYDAELMRLDVRFARSVTERELPQQSGVPGPGIYRFDFDANILRAAVTSARLDGDGDGFAESSDHYSQDDIVGDVGDKTASEIIPVTNPQSGAVNNVNVYAPVNLDVVLDNNLNPDGVADINTVFTIRGAIGNHPDNDTNTFRFASEIDVFTVTLQAGQILRIGTTSGPANLVARSIYNAAGVPQGGVGGDIVALPSTTDALGVPTEFNLLVRETGQYFLVVSANADTNELFNQPGDLLNIGPVAGAVGDYAFTLEVFDDGDSGFNATTDSGNGADLVDAPFPIDFAGPDGQFGTGDDLSVLTIGGFEFTLNIGDDGTPNTGDDIVSGTLGDVTSIRQGTTVTYNIDSSIGAFPPIGVPTTVVPDVDVFHFSGGEEIDAGTRYRVTIKLSHLGSDLGARINNILPDLSGVVQFAIFETTNSTDIDDATLLFSPSDFMPTASDAGVIADDGQTAYGYDENGDFFIEFVTPGAIASADPNNPDPASYALYLQGAFQTGYEIEVVREGTGSFTRKSQNFFLETRGGNVDWLESGGMVTDLASFTTRIFGFTGLINNQPVDTYVLTNLVASLNELFAAAGLDVEFSTNPAAFEFEDFSTVFLSTTNDPISFFSDGIFGYSEHVDPLNVDANDEAVVFAPTYATLGYTPAQADIDDFVDSLTAGVARRAAELMGLRITGNAGAGAVVDPMAANSVSNIPTAGGVYRLPSIDRPLSSLTDSLDDTDFFLGNQNSLSLLDSIIAAP